MSIHDFEKPSLTTDIVLLRVLESESPDNRRNSDYELQILMVNMFQIYQNM